MPKIRFCNRRQTLLREEGACEAFGCESQIALVDCGKGEDELHVARAVELRRGGPIKAFYPDSGGNCAVESILFREFDLEVGQEMHTCIVSIDCDFSPEVLLQ